jgi:Bestrophin, RFP-TM, chloride channel
MPFARERAEPSAHGSRSKSPPAPGTHQNGKLGGRRLPGSSGDFQRGVITKTAGTHQELFRDRVFTDKDWTNYMSYTRYMIEPKVFLKVLVTLAVPLVMVELCAIALGIYQSQRKDSYADLRDLDLTLAYSTVSFALALLLVFKTNTAHARWWEGAQLFPDPETGVLGIAACMALCSLPLPRNGSEAQLHVVQLSCTCRCSMHETRSRA